MTTASGHTDAILASRVIGTNVYSAGGDQIGEIKDVVLKKASNGVMFAIVGFGGFLDIGEKYCAVPWSSLDYNVDAGGYVVPFTREQIESAQHSSIGELTSDDGVPARDQAYAHYGVEPYWQ